MCYRIILTMAVCSAALGKEPEYLSIYRRIPQHYLKAMPQKVLEHATVEDCARACVIETGFECKSFDYDNSERECHLHNHTHHEPLIGLQEALDVDHYRTAYDKLFNRIPNHVITMRHKRRIQGVRVEECARRCILEMTFRCTGFDYGKPSRLCLLTDKVPADVNGLRKRANTDFYERKSNGPLSRFINYGYGSLQTIEGVQIHTKIVLGVNLYACAQLCLAETTFKCASFDYIFGEQSCQLSEYIAANVHGMRTDFGKRYRVMHYELIEIYLLIRSMEICRSPKRKLPQNYIDEEHLDYFYPTPYASVIGRNEKTLRKMSPDACARRCLEERDFICRSFDYQIQKGTCLLSHVTGSDAGGLYTLEGVHVHHFEMKPSLDCGGIEQRDKGTIASPNWPRHYFHHLNCTWTIRTRDFRITRIEIHHLDLGPQSDDACSEDNDILSVSEQTLNGKKTRCIQNYETEISTETNEINITFVTNAENDAQGFRLFYFADWPCKVTLTSDNGEFATPRWPNAYPPSSKCYWRIQGPPLSQIVLRFNSVQLEDHTGSNCKTAYDKIEIYDGDTEHSYHVTTICGYKNSFSFTSSVNSLFVSFVSDHRVQAKGFHASYRFILSVLSTSLLSTSATTTRISLLPATTNEGTKMTENELNNGDNNTKEIVELFANKTVDLRKDTQLQNNSSVKMALVEKRPGAGKENEEDKLDAEFIEPPYNVYEVNSTDPRRSNGKVSDDIGMGLQPDIHYDIKHTHTYTSIIWGVVLSVCTTCLIMTSVILLVCRYYRKRLPKQRQGVEHVINPDENLSLCQKQSDKSRVESALEYPDEADIEDAARLPLPRDHSASLDVEFQNPLYLESPNLEPEVGDSVSQTLVVMTTTDLDISSNENNEYSSNCRYMAADMYNSRSETRGSLLDTESSILNDDTSSTALLIERQSGVNIDCFTTV